MEITRAVCDAKMARHKDMLERDKERLDKLDEVIASLSKSNALLTQMVAGHDKNIEKLKDRPVALWDKVLGGFIAALSGGLAAAVLSLIFK